MKKYSVALGMMAVCSSAAYAKGFDLSMLPAVPCKQHITRPKLDRNQSSFFAQCDFDKRFKVSGSIRASTGIANDVLYLSSNDRLHKLTLNANRTNAALTNVESSSDAWLQHARFNVDAVLAQFAESHVSTVFRNEHNIFSVVDASYYNRFAGAFQRDLNDAANKVTGNNNRGNTGNHLAIDEANVMLGNFNHYPVFARVGRQYMDFGWYDKDVPVATFTQLLTQSSNDAITVGFVDLEGLSASVSTFRSVSRQSTMDVNGTNTQDKPESLVNNVAASIAYGIDFENISIDLKADYMLDMYGVDFFDGYNGQGVVGAYLFDPVGTAPGGPQTAMVNIVRPDRATPMAAFTLNTHLWDFDFLAQYAGAMRMIDKGIWSKGGSLTSTFDDPLVDGMRPHAWMIEAGYSLAIMGRDTRLSLNMQRTRDLMAGNLNTQTTVANVNYANIRNRSYYHPSQRFQLNIEHNLMNDIDLSLNYIRDKDYNNSQFHRLGNTSRNGATRGDLFDAANGGNYQGTDNHNEYLIISLIARFN